MKKIVLMSLFAFCLVLTGCAKKDNNNSNQPEKEANNGPQTLICAKDTESPMHFTTEMIYSFENNSIVNLGVRYTYDLSSYSDDRIQAFADSKMCETDAIKNDLGMTECVEKLEGKSYIVTGNAKKLLGTSNGTLDEVKKSYTSAGWKCTEE